MANNKGLRGPDKQKVGVAFKAQPHIEQMAKQVSELSYEYLFDAPDDQSSTNSCVAHGTAATFEAFMKKRQHKVQEVSRAAIYARGKTDSNCDPTQDDGMFVSGGLNVCVQHGYIPESQWGFNPSTILNLPPDNLWVKDFFFKGFTYVANDVASMQKALLQHGPLVIGTSFASEWEQPGPDGMLQGQNLTPSGGHCMVIVGYSESRQAFRVRNSWGTNWGDNGYCWLPYSAATTQCWPYDIYTIIA